MTYASRHAQHPNGKWDARNAEFRADTHRYPVWVLLPDALCLGLALLWIVGQLMSSDRAHRRAAPPTEGVLILELGPHYVVLRVRVVDVCDDEDERREVKVVASGARRWW